MKCSHCLVTIYYNLSCPDSQVFCKTAVQNTTEMHLRLVYKSKILFAHQIMPSWNCRLWRNVVVSDTPIIYWVMQIFQNWSSMNHMYLSQQSILRNLELIQHHVLASNFFRIGIFKVSFQEKGRNEVLHRCYIILQNWTIAQHFVVRFGFL